MGYAAGRCARLALIGVSPARQSCIRIPAGTRSRTGRGFRGMFADIVEETACHPTPARTFRPSAWDSDGEGTASGRTTSFDQLARDAAMLRDPKGAFAALP